MREKELERIFKAFANKRRIAILRYLKKNNTATVGEIAEVIKLSLKATSKHLSILSSVDLVDREQKSLYMQYSLANDISKPISQIISML